MMHSCQYIEENICFSNGGTNLHIHTIAQGRPEDNQVEFLQGPHGIVNRPKNLVLNNIRRFTMEHIGAANGLYELAACPPALFDDCSLRKGNKSSIVTVLDGLAPSGSHPPSFTFTFTFRLYLISVV